MPVTISKERANISEFIKNHPAGVLATANTGGSPHAACVYFVTDDELNIYFVTKEETTKHKNLQQNPLASLAIYDERAQATLQANGKAEVIKDIELFTELFNRILDISVEGSGVSRPPVSKLFAGNYFMYKLTPHSLRLAEYTKPDIGDFENLFQVVEQ